MDTLKLKWNLRGHTDSVLKVEFSNNGNTLASASYDTTVRLWDMQSGGQTGVLYSQFGLHSLQFSPDCSRILAGSELGSIRVWNTDSGRLLHDFNAHWNVVRALDFLDSETLVSCSLDNVLQTWRMSDLPQATPREFFVDPLKVFNVGRDRANAMAISPNGKHMAACQLYGNLSVWDLRDDRKIASFSMRPTGQGISLINCLAYLPSEEHLVTCSSLPIKLMAWSTAQYGKLPPIYEKDDTGGNMGVSPDGRFAALSDWSNKSLDLIKLETGELLSGPVFPGHGNPFPPIFSPDGETIVVPTKTGKILLVTTSTRKISKVLPFDDSGKQCVAVKYSPDGRMLLSGGDDGILKLWDTSTWKTIADLQGHDERVITAAFSPDGQYFVTGGGELGMSSSWWSHQGEICIWDVKSHKLLLKFNAHDHNVTCVVFTPDGKGLLTCGYDGKARLWDFAQLLAAGECK